MNETITVHPSPTADTRTCDFKNVTRAQLFESSVQHIHDVQRGLAFFQRALAEAAASRSRLPAAANLRRPVRRPTSSRTSTDSTPTS